MNKSFYLLTYGCQMNVYDSMLISEILRRNGYKEMGNEGEADIIIVNTCSVRGHAEKRVIGRIGDLQKLRREKKNLIVGLVGCMAQNFIDQKKNIKGVDFMLGPAHYIELPNKIKNINIPKPLAGVRDDRNVTPALETLPDSGIRVSYTALTGYPAPLDNPYDGIYPEQGDSISAFLPVMRGCDNFCSYCIVPYVRVGVQMRSPEDILSELDALLKKGTKEIILLGQSVNEYKYRNTDFPDILKLVSKAGVSKIGFFTSHPYYTTQKLIDVMSKCENIYKWIHLPLQSGSDRILKKMNRKYTKKDYIELVHKARKKIPGISLTTDIVVGFPGETEKDFRETIELIKEIQFDFAYMFKYSDRERTAAFKLKPKITEQVKTKRLAELIEIQNRITHNKNKQLVGTVQEVLVECQSKRNNGWRGKTKHNKIIVFRGNAVPGEMVKVKIDSLKGWTPCGAQIRNVYPRMNTNRTDKEIIFKDLKRKR